MFFTANSLAYYLLERGLLKAEAVVDGDLVIVDSTSRNRNFKVISRSRPGYFVKQVQQGDPQTTEFLRREAGFYWLTANDPGFAALAPWVPAYYLYDPRRHALVIELLPEGENLAEYHRRLGSFPLHVAASLGEVLGSCHRLKQLSSTEQAARGDFPRSVPWILSAHQLGASPLHTIGGANQQILGIISRHTDFHRHLDSLREQWQTDCLIHGDMKWENCIVYGRGRAPELKIIDWETADFGDGGWDVGAIFQAYLTFWIMSIPIQGESVPADFLQRATYPIEAMLPAIRAFWLAYVQARQLAVTEQQEVLQRSVGYGAARMLQTAYEYMYYAPQVTPNALALLQVSLNILHDARGAARDLLNL